MNEIVSIFSWKAVAILIILHVLGWVYNWFVYKYLPSKYIKNRTAELVVGGTLGTITGFGVWIGWTTVVWGYEAILALLCCFFATGLPMIIGYWMKESRDSNDDEVKARQRLKEHAQKAIAKRDGE